MALNRWAGLALLLLFYSCNGFDDSSTQHKQFNTHWLETGSRTNRKASSELDVYCHKGRPKYFFSAWQTVWLHLDIKSDDFNLYEGSDPQSAWEAYNSDSYAWQLPFFSEKKSPSVRLDPFTTRCVAVQADEAYSLRVEINDFDREKLTLLFIGLILFLSSRSLSENSIFFYAVGITLGICASFMVVIYFISKLFPKKPLVYGSMLGGWAVGLYFFRFIWNNFQPLLIAYNDYVIWYTIAMGFVSFIVCYKIGAPKDKRNKNIISWILQAIGLTLVYFSCYIIEVSLAMCLILLTFKYIPNAITSRIKSFWMRRFPPKRKLLTDEEYREQGLHETAKALTELKQYCSSPECNQWKLMLQLKNPEKFAKFISADNSHVSDDEIEEHEMTDFRINRPRVNGNAKLSLTEDDFTDDDSSLSADDL